MNLRTSVTRDAALHLLLKSSMAGRTQDAPAWRAECLRLLMRARADLNQADGEGAEPLMLLLRPALQVAGRVELAMEMLDAGAKVRPGGQAGGGRWEQGHARGRVALGQVCAGGADVMVSCKECFVYKTLLFNEREVFQCAWTCCAYCGLQVCNDLDPTMGMGWIHFFCDDPICIRK